MSPQQHSHTTDEPSNRDIMTRLEHLDQRFERIERFVTGDNDPEKGIILRLDRVEQHHENRKFWTQTAVGAALTSIIASAWSIFQK